MANEYRPQFLRSISPSHCALKLACGGFIWLGIRTISYFGLRGAFSKYVRGRDEGVEEAVEDGKEYLASMAAEHVVSCALCPIPYLAGSLAPRFLLDYMLTWFSDIVCVLDRFNPSEYASFSVYAFESGDEDWSLSFFSWQMPAVVLTLGKLFYRRYKYGKKSTKTLKVLGVLGGQLLIRAYLTSFSIMLPDSTGSAFQSIVACFIDSLATRYLIVHTSPFNEGKKA